MSKIITTEEIVKKAITIHGDKYGYGKVIYVNMKSPIIITCPIHGDFKQLPQNHINHKCGCPKCVKERPSKKLSNKKEFVRKGIFKHKGKYGYDDVIYVDSYTKVIINCPIHGNFLQTPNNHLNGQGCIKCGYLSSAEKNTSNDKEFESKSIILHGNKYNYENSVYNGSDKPIRINCPIHGDFIQTPKNHLKGEGCPKCYWDVQVSKTETEIIDFVKSLGIDIETSNRTILKNGQELDIYIPSKKIAFEYDGLYWHNECHKDKKYHLRKTEECLNNDVTLIHIFEDEWLHKQDIVKSRIMNILGISKNHFYARKCIVKHVSSFDSRNFLKENHLQGNYDSSINLGLYTKNKSGNEILLGLMTFSSLRGELGSSYKDDYWELNRYCNLKNLHIVGGASKLLKYFIRYYFPKNIISYCDRRWSVGNLYEKLGFSFVHNSTVNYFYVIGTERMSRNKFMKYKLVDEYVLRDDETEHEFCFSQGWYRIYDCGNKKYELNLKQK